MPTTNLPRMLDLCLRILEGIQKHAKDPDYPTQLDVLGLPAGHDHAALTMANAKAQKNLAKRATAEAVAERTLFGVILEKAYGILIGAYGKRNPILLDYGFRLPTPRTGRRVKRAGKKGTSTGAATSPAAGPAGESSTSSPASAPEPPAAPPSATPKG